MTRYLLDTNVLSDFSRSKLPPDPSVKRWIEGAHPSTLFVRVLSFGEIRRGIDLLAPGKKRETLEHWLTIDLSRWFEDRLLPVTQPISNRWGIVAAHLQLSGKSLGTIDGLLGPAAVEHGFDQGDP